MLVLPSLDVPAQSRTEVQLLVLHAANVRVQVYEYSSSSRNLVYTAVIDKAWGCST